MATSRSCSTPAAPPASPRARCSRTATWSRTCCRRMEWIGPSFPRDPADADHRVAAVSHLRVDRELPAVRRARLAQHTHHESARFPRVRRRAAQVQVLVHQRREHAVQCAVEYAGLRQGRLQRPQGDARRRHGRAGSRRQAMEGSDRQDPHAGLGTRRRHHPPRASICQARISTDPSACRFRRPRSAFATTKARNSGSTTSAKSACAGRR